MNSPQNSLPVGQKNIGLETPDTSEKRAAPEGERSPRCIGEVFDRVEIHDFPEEGDVSEGQIVERSIDEIVRDRNRRFRKVLVERINGKTQLSQNGVKRVNLTPNGLIPLESSKGGKVQRYRFNFRDQANAIVLDPNFQSRPL